MAEGELFSFRVLRSCLLSWRIGDVQEHTTFREVLEELAEQPELAAVCEELSSGRCEVKCMLSQSSSSLEKDWMSVGLNLRVVRCSRFGLHATFIVTRPTDLGKPDPVNAFSIMMAASSAAARPSFALPEKHASPESNHQLHGDLRLENDIIDLLAEKGLGFRNGAEKTAGKTFVRLLRSVLFELLSPARIECFKDRGLHLPENFASLADKEQYNNPEKSKHG